MRLVQETFKDASFGAEEEHKFKLNTDTPILFDILRNQMYSDKIGAVCREIPSNSRDANRDAKVLDKNIEIEIVTPNKLLSNSHSKIIFRDYGYGITPEDIASIYVEYGASTKRDTDEQTGGFGLGAKTPFAYNDTFTVVTVCDWAKPIYETKKVRRHVYDDKTGELVIGEDSLATTEIVDEQVVVGHEPSKRYRFTWTANIDATREGKMTKFGQELTDAPTGTQVIVPIKTSTDRYAFERKCLKYTKTWGNVTYLNFSINTEEKLEVAIETDLYGIYRSQEYLYDKTELLVDGIPYPLNLGLLENGYDILDNSHFLSVLKFKTGELELVPSRESIQYSTKTKEAIQNRLDEAREDMSKKAVNYITGQSSYQQACVINYSMKNRKNLFDNSTAEVQALIEFGKAHSFGIEATWNGIPVVHKFRFKHHDLIRVTLDSKYTNQYETLKEFHLSSKNIESKLFFADTRKNAKRNEGLWRDGEDAFFMLKAHPDSIDGGKAAIEELQDFLFTFDLDIEMYSDLEVIKDTENSVSYTYQKKSYITLNVREIESYSMYKGKIKVDRKTGEGETLDLTEVIYGLSGRSGISSINYNMYSDLKYLASKGYKCYIVKPQDYEKWLSTSGMTHYAGIKEKIEQELIEKNRKEVLKYEIYNIVRDEFPSYLKETPLYDMLPKTAKEAEEVKSIDDLCYSEREKVKDTLKFNFSGLRKKIKAIFELYPMVDIIMGASYKYSKADKVKYINEYFNLLKK